MKAEAGKKMEAAKTDAAKVEAGASAAAAGTGMKK